MTWSPPTSWLAAGAGCLVLRAAAVVAATPGAEQVRVDPVGRITLARLVDLAASQAGVAIDYSPEDLDRTTVAIRLPEALTPPALWLLANQALAGHGFTTVRTPGSDSLSVVKLADAAGVARLENAAAEPPDPPAGFETRIIDVSNRPGKDVIESIKILLSRPGGAATAVGDGTQIVVSDLRARVEQVQWMVDQLDGAEPPSTIETITAQHVPAVRLAAMVAAAIEARKAISHRPVRGSLKLAAAGDDSTLLLVAPADELDFFRSLIEQLDRRGEIGTISYSPRGFELERIAALLEESVRDPGPRGSGDRWKVVLDPLSGALIVTATPAEHERIRATMDRLAALPPEARVPVRTYAIRNRSVEEVVTLLQDLVASGVLAADTSFEAGTAFDAGAASQRTSRDVLPAGARPLVETAPGAASRAAASPPEDRGGRGGARAGGSAAGRAAGALSITADPATNILIASGEPRLLAQLESLLRTLDVRQPQVMLEVLVLSLNDSDTLDLGVELETLIQSGDTFIRLASLFGLGPLPLLPPVGGAVPPATGQGGTALVLRPGDYGMLIRALETMNEGRALNIPKILVNNNEQGTLDSTLQIPFISTNASTTVATTSFGGTEDAGTTVTIKPQIAAGDHMRLEYAVSLSSFVGAASDPSLPPPKQQNSLQSVVTIPDGHTVALGGLEIRTEGEAITQVPFIGDVPGVGELFKKRSRTATRTRFFVFITPQVLRREGFEDLRHLSGVELRQAELEDRFPTVEAQIVR